MDPKRIVMLVVGASVMVLIFSAILVPIINDATETERTFTNAGYFTMDKYTPDEDITVSWDHSDPDVVTVGDETIDITAPIGKWVSIVVGDNWYFRYIHTNADVREVQMSYGGVATITASTSNEKDLTLECSEGTATGTVYAAGVAETPKTASYTELYVISKNGEYYIMKDSDAASTMLKDSKFIGVGQTFLSGGASIIKVEGSIDDGATVTIVGSTVTATVDTDTISVNATPKSGYIDCYDLSSITFDVTTSGGTTHATYSYFIVPAEVTAELAVHPDSATNALLSAIPIIAMVGIVLAVVSVAIVGRNDY